MQVEPTPYKGVVVGSIPTAPIRFYFRRTQ